MQTMSRTRVALDDAGFFLAQDQDVADLRRRIEDAVHSGGAFVEFVAAGDRSMSVLISSASKVVISVESVDFDARDLGDDALPYGGEFDLL
ncbi:hypothetical protein CQ040_11930 [Microbacterium sp. MYb54]|uniref:hypothetical protein n=2 Tax=unclassified Microbacterium TaxID=2609290 RepID=UPI000CFB0860|nr:MULTISPECIES: hypothetical protein [unclassified Microbacterium]PQZ58326.1 hypothetical protein CQ032_06665 [Microbacterium sp. MYb43]PRB66687.1 hypothetical protein CQ021_10790 [Microbacterium sp. MYb24]PRB74078.1 hypothetical protein CQ027_11520 [Microbacterium sp. MYb32]PQZ78430.1 hypothetical protein CQ031_10980 [Microbacterium sp. MYb40]PRB20665.1 hypothetical protein CQ040_11930 [Microbacterium sp. MYb54]